MTLPEGPRFDRATLLAEVGSLGIEISPTAEIFAFGDGPAMAAELGELVRLGKKTATAALGWEFDHTGEALPNVGDRDIVIDWNGHLLAVTELTEVLTIPFNDVDETFAADEGEGDLSLAYWRRAHWEFFARVCAWIDRTPADDMPVVCQRFRLIYPQ